MFDGIATSLQYIRAGKLKALGVSSPTRVALLPQVPTFAELGYPEIDFVNWIGVVASARVTPALTAAINRELLAVAAAPGPRERRLQLGFGPAGVRPPGA